MTARMVFSVFSTSVSSTLFEIARGGTSITTLPNVRRYIPFFLPSSKTILLMDVPFARIGIFVRHTCSHTKIIIKYGAAVKMIYFWVLKYVH